METIVLILGTTSIIIGAYFILDKLLFVAYRLFVLFRFLRDVREEQAKEVDKLLNGE